MTTNTNAAVDSIISTLMTQVQVCASAYALIGSRFDRGHERENFETEMADLRNMLDSALSTAAQLPADGALNTIAAMFHSGEEIEGPDGLAMMVDMSVWNDALDAFDEISGDEMEPAQPPAKPVQPERVSLTDLQIDEFLPLGVAGYSALIGDDEIRAFARAVEATHGIKPAKEDKP